MNRKTKSKIKILIKAGFLFFLFFFINQALVHFYGTMMKENILFKLDANFQKKNKMDVDSIVLGDSHSLLAIREPFFKGRLINWSSHGESYMMNYYKLKYYLSNKQLKILILPFDLHSFSSFRARTIGNDYFWIRYVDYMEVGITSGKFFYYMSKYLKAKLFPYVGESNMLYEWFVRKVLRLKPALLRQELSATKEKKKKRKSFLERRIALHFKDKDYFYKIPVEYFKKILALCKTKDVTVLLVKLPVTGKYYRSASGLVPVSQWESNVQAILKNYNNVHVLDYRDLFFCQQKYMLDTDHVNKKGARIVSRKINRFILENFKEN
jgi:hypothetical protein